MTDAATLAARFPALVASPGYVERTIESLRTLLAAYGPASAVAVRDAALAGRIDGEVLWERGRGCLIGHCAMTTPRRVDLMDQDERLAYLWSVRSLLGDGRLLPCESLVGAVWAGETPETSAVLALVCAVCEDVIDTEAEALAAVPVEREEVGV